MFKALSNPTEFNGSQFVLFKINTGIWNFREREKAKKDNREK